MALKIVRLSELPPADQDFVEFRQSSFFRNNHGKLPSPNDVRRKAVEVHGEMPPKASHPPVFFKDQGLAVKYGWEITVAEAQCLWYMNKYMKDEVPTPELYGWCRDNGETFIYMQFVDGDTLEDAWPQLTEAERDHICRQLRSCVKGWRGLHQESEPYFIGHIGRQGVGDIIFHDIGDPHPGPFTNLAAFHDYFARCSCRRHPEWNPRLDFPELVGLSDDRPVVFTHGDFHRNNIIVSRKAKDLTPRVLAIIDWHQSGWYPIDWEWLKAQWMCEIIDDENGSRRDTDWLLKIMDPAEQGYWYAWEFVTSSL